MRRLPTRADLARFVAFLIAALLAWLFARGP